MNLERQFASAKESLDDSWKQFLGKFREELKNQNPNYSKRELYRLASDKWRTLSETEKESYRKTKKKRKTKKSESSDDDSDVFHQEIIKKHISAYSVFVNEKQNELKDSNPSLSLSERTKLISELWTTLSKDEKAIYNNKAKCINRAIDRASSDDENPRYPVNIPASRYSYF